MGPTLLDASFASQMRAVYLAIHAAHDFALTVPA